jgi:hypothetical protein
MTAPLRIGIDFDNTIACYGDAFHAAALERGVIPANLPKWKNAVRDHLNGSGRKDAFTELQGCVYGARMDLVAPYPGVAEFISAARASGHELFVVSHKTRYPIVGARYDLHEAARGFLDAWQLTGGTMVRREHVHFEVTKEQKVARAAALDLDVFIDDLPEILALPGFPPGMRRVLFDPDSLHRNAHGMERCSHWADIRDLLLGMRV